MDKLPGISPVLDAKNDMMYALQNGNTRLCCWNALTVQGPDDTKASKVDLSKPAVSLGLLPLHKGAVYGTCTDGSIFIARLDHNTDNQDELSVEYLPNRLTKGVHTHSGTIAQLPQGAVKGGSRKRKMSDADGHTTVYFYQCFHDDLCLDIVRHEVLFEKYSVAGGKMIVNNSLDQRVLNIPLVVDVDHAVVDAQMTSSSTGNESLACVTYRVQRAGGTQEKTFSALLSLTTGKLERNTVELPSGTRQYGVIGDSLLVIGTEKSIQLFDIESCAVLCTASIPTELLDRQDWCLYANPKIGAVSLVYEDKGSVCLAISSLTFDDIHGSLGKRKLPFASKLASSVFDTEDTSETRNVVVMHNALNLKISEKKNQGSLQEAVDGALKSLDEARTSILSPSSRDVPNYLFMDTYEASVAMVLEALKTLQTSSDGSPRNPQDDDSQSGAGGKNGHASSHPAKKLKNGTNGVHSILIPHTKALTPSLLPQAFIDGATQIVVTLLQCGKIDDEVVGRRVSLARLDARIILHQLLNTGKLSARFHFDATMTTDDDEHPLTSALRSIKLSNKRGRRCFSPVDMIMTMLRRCPDVSERQMVVMLSYMMRRALPEDIAEMFIDERKHYRHIHYANLARKFFSVRSSLYKTKTDDEAVVQSPELDRLGRKLILTGTSYVLYRIAEYSQCNEAMLRVAMQDGMETREAVILARCLSNIFASKTNKEMFSKAPQSRNAVKSICQWVAAVCDTFHEDLAASPSDSKGGKSCLVSLLEAIISATKQSQAILSLKEEVRRVESDIQSLRDTNVASMTRILPNPEDLPGYSVEKLVF